MLYASIELSNTLEFYHLPSTSSIFLAENKLLLDALARVCSSLGSSKLSLLPEEQGPHNGTVKPSYTRSHHYRKQIKYGVKQAIQLFLL